MSTQPKDTQAPATATDEVEEELYAKRQKIYPREVHGIFANLRVLGMATLLGIYYGVPWLGWDGRQAVLFDLPARKFHIFGLTFWPQDFFFLAVLLIVLGIAAGIPLIAAIGFVAALGIRETYCRRLHAI